MTNKPEITWKELGVKAGGLALDATALGLSAVRKAGETAGGSVAAGFVKNSDEEALKARKIKIGEKTGALTSSLLTFGVIGNYIIDLADHTDSKTENSSPKSDVSKAEVVIKPGADPIDSNGDGIIDGCDIDGDGESDLDVIDGVCLTGSDTVIYVNDRGVAIGDMQYVEGYETENGRVVESGYFRTEADGIKENNLG